MNFIERIFDITKRKYIINEKTADTTCNRGKTRAEWNCHEIYLTEMQNEIKEMQEELRHDNAVYLEDELGDIFWDYMSLLYDLEKEGYISKEKVFERSEKKFAERISALENGKSWEEIKTKQKAELKAEHQQRYSKK